MSEVRRLRLLALVYILVLSLSLGLVVFIVPCRYFLSSFLVFARRVALPASHLIIQAASTPYSLANMTYGSSSVSLVSSPSSPPRQETPPLVPAVPGLYTLPLRPASTYIPSKRQSLAQAAGDPDEIPANIAPSIFDLESQPPVARLSDTYTISSLHRTWSKDGNNPENWLAHRRWAIIVLLAIVSAVV